MQVAYVDIIFLGFFCCFLSHQQNGQRCTIGTIDGNNVDAMFFDRRAEGCVNGDTLVSGGVVYFII